MSLLHEQYSHFRRRGSPFEEESILPRAPFADLEV